MTGALSRCGNPSDNAKAERCIKALKVEAVYLRDHATFEDVATDLPGFIEEVYDTGSRFPSVACLDRVRIRGCFARRDIGLPSVVE